MSTLSNLIVGIVYICIIANPSFVCFYVQNNSVAQQEDFSVIDRRGKSTYLQNQSYFLRVIRIQYLMEYKNHVVSSRFEIKILNLLHFF